MKEIQYTFDPRIPEDEKFVPKNKEVFERMMAYRERIGLCSDQVKERFYSMFEDEYNFDDIFDRSGAAAYPELFAQIDSDWENRERILSELKGRFGDRILLDYIKFNPEIIQQAGIFPDEIDQQWILRGEMKVLESYDLDMLSKLKEGIDGLSIDETEVIEQRKNSDHRKQIADSKNEKKAKERLIKSLGYYVFMNRDLDKRLFAHFGLGEIKNQNDIQGLRAEQLENLIKAYQEIQQRTRELGGDVSEEEDLIIAWEDILEADGFEE